MSKAYIGYYTRFTVDYSLICQCMTALCLTRPVSVSWSYYIGEEAAVGGWCYLVPGFQGRTGICQIASKIIISGKLIFFLLSIVNNTICNWYSEKNGIIPLCASRREKKYFWRGRFRRGSAARSWLSYPTVFHPIFVKADTCFFRRQKCAFGKCFFFV